MGTGRKIRETGEEVAESRETEYLRLLWKFRSTAAIFNEDYTEKVTSYYVYETGPRICWNRA